MRFSDNMRMQAIELATPRNRVETLFSDMTIGEAIKVIEKKKFQMIPVIERDSKRYLYSVSAGDILRKVLKEKDLSKVLADPISSLSIERLIVACSKETEISELIYLVVNQNFVPLVDSAGVLQGIVTRRAIIDHLASQGE